MKTPVLLKRLLLFPHRLCLVFFLSLALPSYAVPSLPCSENFDAVTTPALPQGWTSISLPAYYPNQVITTIVNYSTNNIAVSMSNYIQGSTAEYMLISPEISMLNNSLLRFKAWNGSQYPATLLVGYMTDPKDPSTFVSVQKIEHMPFFTPASQTAGFHDLPDEARYIAFRHGNILEGESNMPIYIDDFELEILPANPAPSNLYGLGTSASAADLSWSENGSANKWEIKYGAKGFNPSTEGTSLIIENTPSATLDNLNSFSTYDFYVRSILADLSQSEWAGPVSFGTYQQALQVPFLEDFESSTANDWMIVNGSQYNKWHLGGAEKHQGSQAVYISDNEGTDNRYNTNETSLVHIFRDIRFPEQKGKFYLEYWIKGYGQFLDYLRVHITDANNLPLAGSGLKLCYYIGEAQVYNNPNWSERIIELDQSLAGKTCRLVFSWSNNASSGVQPPAAIDDIQLVFEPYNTVTGSVYGLDNNPVQNARIVIGDLSAQTDQDGNYVLNGLPRGTYSVWCEAPKHATQFEQISLGTGDTCVSNFQLNYRSDSLPADLGVVTELPDNEGYQHTAVNGAHVYSPDFENTLRIYDCTNPASPLLSSTLNIPSVGNAFFGDYLFVGSTSDRLEIYDCSKANSPAHIDSWLIQGEAKGMAFHKQHAYVISQSGSSYPILGVADLRDTASITEVHTETLAFTGWSVMTIDEDRNLLYILGYCNDTCSLLSIFDISNPSSIDELSCTEIHQDVCGFVLTGKKVVLAYNKDNYKQGYLEVFDTSNPAQASSQQIHTLPEGCSIYEISEYQGSIFGFVRPNFSLVSFVYDAKQNQIYQGLSSKVYPDWIDASLTFLELPTPLLRSASTLNETLIAVSTGNVYGSGSPPQNLYKVSKTPSEIHSLTMGISPEEAAVDGCTVTPEPGKTHIYTRPTTVPIKASPGDGWFFSHWEGATGEAESEVLVEGDVEVTGVFGPILLLTDSKPRETDCCCNVLQSLYQAGSLTFSALQDDWKLMGFTMNSSGTGDDLADIDSVVAIANKEIICHYSSDNGKAVVTITPPIVIPENTSFTIYILYNFGFDPETYALDTVKTFEWITNAGSVQAFPVHYSPGLVEGLARMRTLSLGRVLNDTDAAFSTIEEAVEKTAAGGSIILCPLEHETNVSLDKNLIITGQPDRKKATIVRAKDQDKPIFQLMPEANKTEFKEFIISK